MGQITGSAPRGQVGIVIETVGSGEIPLLAPTAVIASMTLTTQPSGSTGMRLHARVYNHTTSGTITLTGTDAFGGALNETINVPPLPSQPSQSAQTTDFEFVTVGVFGAVTTIATTGLAGGVLVIGGIQGAKFLLPINLQIKQKHKKYSPNEYRGIIERDSRIIEQTNEVTIDTMEEDVYPDTSLWWPYMLMGNPVVTTIPSTPTSLKASGVIASSMTLTTQPTAPGMKLILVVTAWTALVTLTITGTNNFNQAVSEVVTLNANGTYYTSNIYNAVSGITASAITASLAITGAFGWQLDWTSGGNPNSAALEYFDGVMSMSAPFAFLLSGDFEANSDGQAKITAKGRAQDKLPIGDRTTNPLNTNRLQTLAQPTDLPMAGWQGQIFLDPITGTAGTTQFFDMVDLKVSLDVPIEPKYLLNNTYNYTRAYAGKRTGTFEATIDFLNLTLFEQFRQNLKNVLQATWQGPFVGTVGTTPFYKGWTWFLPFKFDESFDETGGPDAVYVEGKLQGKCEYDPGLGYSYKLRVITQQPPVYNQ